MRIRSLFAGAVLALAATVGVANALPTTNYSGTFSLVDTTANSKLGFSSAPKNFSWDLALNQTQLIDPLASFTTAPTGYNSFLGFSAYNDDFRATFTFTAPSATTVSTTGDINEYVTTLLGRVSSAGVLVWDQHSLPVTFSNGDAIRIDLADIAFQNFGGAADAMQFAAYVTETKVPEPASLALLGAGLVGAGMIRRRKAANTPA